MEYKTVITTDEVQKNIVIPNTGGWTYIAKKENTGYDEDQVFTSEVFPKEISGIFIGFTEIDSKIYPVYVLDVISKDLFLCGSKGYNNIIKITYGICDSLLHQNRDDILLARSIIDSDLESFNYKKEPLTYWLASKKSSHDKNKYWSYNRYSVKSIWYGKVKENLLFEMADNINSVASDREYIYNYPIRPVVVLNSQITDIEKRSDYRWIDA